MASRALDANHLHTAPSGVAVSTKKHKRQLWIHINWMKLIPFNFYSIKRSQSHRVHGAIRSKRISPWKFFTAMDRSEDMEQLITANSERCCWAGRGYSHSSSRRYDPGDWLLLFAWIFRQRCIGEENGKELFVLEIRDIRGPYMRNTLGNEESVKNEKSK